MLTLNSNILKIGDAWLNPVNGSGPTPTPTTYYVTTSATHGTVTASPTEGISGTEVTLSNTPDTHYHFGSYSLTGATLKNANQFDIANSDVSVVGNFIEDTKYSVTCTNDGHGTIAASPTSNYSGSTVTLSNTPNSGYTFDKYTLISGTGASISGNTLTIGTSNVTVRGDFMIPDPYNPLNLPANTVRVRTSDGNAPIKGADSRYDTAILVAGTSDVYDVYKSGTTFLRFLCNATNVVEVLGANTTGITNMNGMFYNCSSLTTVALFNTSSVTSMDGMFSYCSSLTSVPLFDTSNVTNMNGMVQYCSSLTTVPLFDTSSATTMNSMFTSCSNLTTVPLFNTSNVTDMSTMFYYDTKLTAIPLFNTSKVTDMTYMFYNCYKVESGAYALYQQASTQTTPPSSHSNTFRNCGRDTTTGAAELAQIPSDWK